MNAFTKMVLIPEGEYLQLKSQYSDRFTAVLKAATPNQIKQNLLSKMIEQQVPKKKDKVSTILTSNLPKNLKSELISKLSQSEPKQTKQVVFEETVRQKEETMEIEQEFQPVVSSTPQSFSNFYDAVGSIVDNDGQILDSDREPIPASNIVDIHNFAKTPGKRKKRTPLGYNAVLKSLAKKKLNFDINNTQVRDDLERQIQKGQGVKLWSSLRKF